MQKQLVHYFLISVIILLSSAAHAETLTVNSMVAQPGDTISVPITIDVPGKVVGTTFTLTYNSSYFTLTDIQSSFFDTFSNQWQTLDPPPDPMPPTQVTVDGTTHIQPLLFVNVTGATLVSAARVKAGATETTLFTLHFTVNAGSPDGIYPVSIAATSFNNTAAGYPAEGGALPILIGMVEGEPDLSLAYPNLPTDVINGTITVNTAPVDTDGDGIADSWELDYFGDLDTANDVTDYDQDGYTDLQEYLNGYDPLVKDLADDPGYNPNGTLPLPAILMLLLNNDARP